MHHHDPETFDDEGIERPSKTQLKKQSHDLQKLGAEMADMPAHQTDKIDMPESLREALADMRRTKSHEGRRRQLQYIGKIMRHLDPEPLREAVAAFKVPGARETLALHDAERWRDRLVAEDQAVTEWMNGHPETDVQALRTLIRNARKELTKVQAESDNAGTPLRKGRAYRDLFQLVKTGLAAAGDDGSESEDNGKDSDDE